MDCCISKKDKKISLGKDVDKNLQLGKDVLLLQLRKKSFYDSLVKGLNQSIDVPFIGEDTEEKLIRGILDVCIQSLEDLDFGSEN